MFDVGFSELILIFVIALIVLGPERLPKVARTAGSWLGRARRMARSMQYELERELDLKEMTARTDNASSSVTPQPHYGAPVGEDEDASEPGAAELTQNESQVGETPAQPLAKAETAIPSQDPVTGKVPRADGANG